MLRLRINVLSKLWDASVSGYCWPLTSIACNGRLKNGKVTEALLFAFPCPAIIESSRKKDDKASRNSAITTQMEMSDSRNTILIFMNGNQLNCYSIIRVMEDRLVIPSSRS